MTLAVASINEARILLFRPGALGDTILTIDAIAALRAHMPDAWIDLVGNVDAGRLLATWGLIAHVESFDGPDVLSLFRKPPHIADRWRHARCVALWLHAAGDIAAAFQQAGVDVIWADPKPPAGTHTADHLLRTLEPILGPAAREDAQSALPDRWTGAASRTIMVHPGSGSSAKNWPAAAFAELIAALSADGAVVQLLRGPADGAAVGAVLELLPTGQRSTIQVAQPGDAVTLAQMLVSCRAFVGNDSGVSHVAARLGVPTVAIFGATDPRVWAPRGPRISAVGDRGSWPPTAHVLEVVNQCARLM